MTDHATERKDVPARRVLPPVYFLAAIISIAVLHWFLPITTIVMPPFSYAGALVVGVGLFIVIVAARQFQNRETAIRPFEESSALVRDGVYRFTRNPMYLGMVIILTGIAILLGTLAPFLPIPFFAFLIQRRFIMMEEAMLAGKFGDQYREYMAKVRRWL